MTDHEKALFPRVQNVSVVIAAWNGAKYLRETLESVLAQTVPAFEIVVVDDSSQDNSAEIAESFSNVRVIRQANAGRSAARNRGLAEAKGEGVIFLDQDDLLLPDCIQIGLKSLNDAPTASFVAGRSLVIDAEGRSKGKTLGASAPCTYATMLAGSMFVPPSVAIFRTEIIRAIGGFDPSLKLGGEDSDLYLRAAQHHDVVAHGAPVVAYRRHGGNGSGSAYAMVVSSEQFMEKQRAFVSGNPELEKAFGTGRQHWRRLFGRLLLPEALRELGAGHPRSALRCIVTALRFYPRGLFQPRK